MQFIVILTGRRQRKPKVAGNQPASKAQLCYCSNTKLLTTNVQVVGPVVSLTPVGGVVVLREGGICTDRTGMIHQVGLRPTTSPPLRMIVCQNY